MKSSIQVLVCMFLIIFQMMGAFFQSTLDRYHILKGFSLLFGDYLITYTQMHCCIPCDNEMCQFNV